MMVSIAIVIPTHYRINLLTKLVEQLEVQDENNNYINTKIFVVLDEKDTHNYNFLKEKYPSVYLIRGDGNYWFTKSVNEGIVNSLKHNPDYILVLNDDNSIPNDYFTNFINIINKYGKGKVIGSVSLSIHNTKRILFSGVKKINAISFSNVNYNPNEFKDFYSLELIDSKVLIGRGTFYPTSVFKNFGLWDEKLPQYGSDEEFIMRLRKNGVHTYISPKLKLYVNDKTTHSSSTKLKPGLSKYFRSLFNSYSPNSLKKNLYIVTKYGKWYFLPFLYLVQFISVIRVYLKKR